MILRDHNATSYSTETMCGMIVKLLTKDAEIITLRAIALKRDGDDRHSGRVIAEIITLRAIALKLATRPRYRCDLSDRDHNATSYSTET